MAITADDVALEDIIPISTDFAVVEVSSPEELAVIGADTRIRISFLEYEVELRLPFGSQSRLFLSEVNRAWSDVCTTSAQEPKFDWVEKYQKTIKGPGSVTQAFGSKIARLSQRRKSAPKSALVQKMYSHLVHGFLHVFDIISALLIMFIMGLIYKVCPYKANDTPVVVRKLLVLYACLLATYRFFPIRRVHRGFDSRVGPYKHLTSSLGRVCMFSPCHFGFPPTTKNLSINASSDPTPVLPCKRDSESHGTSCQGISSREDRDDLVRSSSHTPSNKAQILAMPQFGLRDNLIRCELLKNEDLYTYLEDFSKEAFFFSDTPKELEWTKAVADGLHPEAKYALVKLVRLVGIMLLFYIKKEHAEFISDIEAETVGTGIMGRMGNKGAVAIRFHFHNSDICVVNCHLAAHTEEYERRNQDFKDICSRLLFRQLDTTQPPLTIMKHDVILWIGDLNYRISDLDVDHVKDLISKKDFETLHSFDQLKRQIDEEAVFVGFEEGEIHFQPTYKYDTGSDLWDTSEKCRVPAWCDRILWKGKNIKQKHYKSHMAVKTSDHKPVSSLLVIGIKHKMENECIPSVTLSKREFHFKDVKFMQHQAETFSLFNDGQVPCQFEFIQKPNETTYCKPWLTANPPKGFVAQGASVEIDLEIFVNRTTAPELNSGKQQIEDILVLHLERGKDYFISVSGNYLPSCYGTSLRSLCQIREPIQEMPQDALYTMLNMPETEGFGEKNLDIPKELWMMVDHLFRNAVKQEDIFQQPGLRSEFAGIRDCLDRGMPDSLPGSNHSVAEALLLFLDALPEPVIPFSFYQQCLECCANASQCVKVISMLPQCHQNVFNYITAFLRELLKNSAQNRLDVNILSTIFASLILRSPTKQDLTEKRKTQEFFQHFLVHGSSPREGVPS
ncbi:hypothetical protein WMY93_026885 [Mugilogobius chulae]|uniref:phosphoinositide 5-phosphatase n=1 Tax=Mugilogobius chulae TaxID=88201 RepID=A0AAW0MZS9_9GOBI